MTLRISTLTAQQLSKVQQHPKVAFDCVIITALLNFERSGWLQYCWISDFDINKVRSCNIKLKTKTYYSASLFMLLLSRSANVGSG